MLIVLDKDSKRSMEKQLNDQIKLAIGDIFDSLPTYFYGLVSTFRDHDLAFGNLIFLIKKNYCLEL